MSTQQRSDEKKNARKKSSPRKSTSGKSAPKKSTSKKNVSGKSAAPKTTANKSTTRNLKKTDTGSNDSAEQSTTPNLASSNIAPPIEPPAEKPTLTFPSRPSAPPEKNETPSSMPSEPEPSLVSPILEDLLHTIDKHTVPKDDTDARKASDESAEHLQLTTSISRNVHWRHSAEDAFLRLRLWLFPGKSASMAGSLPHARREAWLMHPASLILGLAAGWQWAGMKMMLTATIDPSPATVTMLGAIALLMAAVGPRVPGRMVLALVRLFGRRWQTANQTDDKKNDTFWMLQAIRDRDESLLWLSLAVLCSAAGAVTLLTILLSPFAGQFYNYLLDHFFWTPLTLAGLEWIAVTLWMGGAWLMNGLAVSSLASVAATRTESRRSPPGIAAGLLLGLAISWLLHTAWADRGMSATQILMLGVLPMFALSVLAVRLSQRAEQHQFTRSMRKSDLPELSGQTEGWIWLALIVWGFGSTLAGAGWLACQWVLNSRHSNLWSQPSGYMLVLGLGVVLGSFHARHRKQSASGCGMALWAAGVAVGACALLSTFSPSGMVGDWVQMIVLGMPVGYALHYVERAWLARVGSETLGFAQMMTALLAGCAIGAIAALWWVQPALGPMGTMLAGSLIMLAYGGLVQIYEDNNSSHTQRLRLALVFASLAAAIVLFPTGAAYWDTSARKVNNDNAVQLAKLEPADLKTTNRICLIGVSDHATIPALDHYAGQVDLISFTERDSSVSVLSPLDSIQTQSLTRGSCRRLRLERRVYDLIYQNSLHDYPLARFAQFSIEWLISLARQTSPGGHVIVDVGLEDINSEAAIVIASTFQEAIGPHSMWRLINTNHGPTLRLKGMPGQSASSHRALVADWSPIDILLDTQKYLMGPHSIRKDCLTSAIQATTAESHLFFANLLHRSQ